LIESLDFTILSLELGLEATVTFDL